MNKVLLVSVLLGSILSFGCSKDDKPTEPPGPTIITVTAAAGSTAPAHGNVNDPIWNSVAATNVPIAVDQFSSAAKRRPNGALSVASTVAVQALVVNGSDLYFRLTWDDASWDCWPDRFEVTSFAPGSGWAQFTQDVISSREDQLMIFFDGGSEFGWDVWNWRMTTTGAGFLAEGAVLNGTDLTIDPTVNEVAFSNLLAGFGQPVYMHSDGPSNQDYVLLESDTVACDFSAAWSMGDLLAGWYIDGTLYQQSMTNRGDRFDIDAYSSYSSGGYVLVMKRAMSTGSFNDLDLGIIASVNVRIGITNNSDFRFNAGSTNQGFSNTFKLSLP